QAEDGIRDLTVTGVQTCALPILVMHGGRRAAPPRHQPRLVEDKRQFASDDPALVALALLADLPRCPAFAPGMNELDAIGISDARSEERRVGKECRAREARSE